MTVIIHGKTDIAALIADQNTLMKIVSAIMMMTKDEHIIHELELILFELKNQKINTLLDLTLRVRDLLHYVKNMEEQIER